VRCDYISHSSQFRNGKMATLVAGQAVNGVGALFTAPTASSASRTRIGSFLPSGKRTSEIATSLKSRRQGQSRRRNYVVKVSAETVTTESAEKVDWPSKREVLLTNQVRSLSPKEALKLQQEGAVILDVRPKYEYDEASPAGAVNAQIYRLIKEWTPWDIARRAGFAFFGVFNGTEENPDFLQEVEAAGLKKDTRIIVACGSGGTTKPSQNFPLGKESRSLIAAFVLCRSGYKKVVHLEGGVNAWVAADLPCEAEE